MNTIQDRIADLLPGTAGKLGADSTSGFYLAVIGVLAALFFIYQVISAASNFFLAESKSEGSKSASLSKKKIV